MHSHLFTTMAGSCAAQQKCYQETITTSPHSVTSHHQHQVSLCRLCRLQGTVNRYSGVAQENMQLLYLFPFNHPSDRLSLPPSLYSCPSFPLHPDCMTSPQHTEELRQCLENGIRRKLFLLIRHLSARAASGALKPGKLPWVVLANKLE